MPIIIRSFCRQPIDTRCDHNTSLLEEGSHHLAVVVPVCNSKVYIDIVPAIINHLLCSIFCAHILFVNPMRHNLQPADYLRSYPILSVIISLFTNTKQKTWFPYSIIPRRDPTKTHPSAPTSKTTHETLEKWSVRAKLYSQVTAIA